MLCGLRYVCHVQGEEQLESPMSVFIYAVFDIPS
jgi:hypothetical protein